MAQEIYDSLDIDDLIEESYKKREIIKLTVNHEPQIKADEGYVEDRRD